jgi:flagellar protein FliL
MSEPEKATTEAAPKKGGKKLIIIIALVVVLLGGAGGGFFYWRSSTAAAAENPEKDAKASKKAKEKKAADDEEAIEEDKADKSGEKSEKSDANTEKKPSVNSLKASLPEDENVKQVIELQPFIVNLADAEDARYLRLTVSLGVGGEEGKAEKPDTLFTTRVRNAMLAVLAEKKSDDVLSVEGKVKLRKELLKAAQAVSTEPEVEAIYITDFIVQL